jgi:hypothetical protein
MARRCRGILLDGDRGRNLVRQADNWTTAQGIVNASRMTPLIAPALLDEHE